MPTIGGNQATIVDVAKRTDPDGSIAAVAELLNQSNEVIPDVPFIEGNLPTGHRATIRTGLPQIYFRRLNQGIRPSKSTTAQVDETTCMMEARSQIDLDLAMLNGNTAEWRASENKPFIESMGQSFVSKLFYGNVGSEPETFSGLATRYSDATNALNKENIVLGGSAAGQTDNTSIWLVGWGEQTIYGIYPKGSVAGLQHRDLGETDAFDATDNNSRYRALIDWYQWKCGLVVKDWRFAVRIANIDVSNLTSQANQADLLELMAVAVDKIPKDMGASARLCFYANRTVRTILRIQCMNRPNVYLTVGNEEGAPKLSFDGISIKLVDQILNNEARVA
jgi:hypothetical protein